MTIELYLQRSGRFNAKHMRNNAHKCGSMSSRIYSYTVKIRATDRVLTPEGFVMNNELVAEYFAERFGVHAAPWDAVSCENMARIAAREIGERVCGQGVDCQEVEVTITGSNGARITARWEVDLATVNR